MIERLSKDLGSAQKRLFDHSSFVTGEIERFLDNFELKRNETEVQSLFKVTETAGELKYELCNRCAALGSNLDDTSNEVHRLLKGLEEFLAHSQALKPPNESLTQMRLKREQRKAEFCADLKYRYKRIENSFEEKEEEIAEFYSDLQLKLNIKP